MSESGGTAHVYSVVKRMMDLIVASVGLILISPLLLLIGTLVYFSLGRPVFFVQERAGRDGAIFRMFKFRTMKNTISDDGGLLPDGDRLGRVGRILRSTSMDELPELINVVTGDMSLVGPRPLLPQYTKLYGTREATRLRVRPGVTGLAQVRGRNSLSWPEKLEYDARYVERMGPLLDVKILMETVGVVLRRRGVSQDGEPTAALFTGSEMHRKDDGALRLVVFGAGGFSREVVDLIRALGHLPVAYVDDVATEGLTENQGAHVFARFGDVSVEYDGYVAAVGDGIVRQKLVASVPVDVASPTLIHPSACVSDHASLGPGCMVMQNAVINAAAEVGHHVIVNVAAVVAHDCKVGSFTHIAPAVQMGGGSSVGEFVLCGTSSVILPNVSVADRATVGAGAVVVKDVELGSTVVGMPARPITRNE